MARKVSVIDNIGDDSPNDLGESFIDDTGSVYDFIVDERKKVPTPEKKVQGVYIAFSRKTLYQPKTRTGKKEMGNRRLVTSEEVSKFLNISGENLQRLTFRTYKIEGQMLFFAQSVEGYKSRLPSLRHPKENKKRKRKFEPFP